MLTLAAEQFQLVPVFQFGPEVLLGQLREFLIALLSPCPVRGSAVSAADVLRQEPFHLYRAIVTALRRYGRRQNQMARGGMPTRFGSAGGRNQHVRVIARKCKLNAVAESVAMQGPAGLGKPSPYLVKAPFVPHAFDGSADQISPGNAATPVTTCAVCSDTLRR